MNLRTLRIALIALGVAGYALLSHLLMVYAPDAPWAVAALFGPLLVPCLVVAVRKRQGFTLVATLAAILGIAIVVARGGLGEVQRLYVLQHAGWHVALGLVFAASLRGPGLSLITQLALRVHDGRMTPEMMAYSAKVTRLWVGYFLGMAGISVLLFLLGPWRVWSLFANVLTPLAIVLLLVGEHVTRYRLHPEFERVSLSVAVRAFQRGGAANSVAGR